MSKIKYADVAISPIYLKRIANANKIIDYYATLGFNLTLRQLYYQLVSRNLIKNHQNQYVALGEAVKKGRMAGLIDWDAIVDRNRVPKIPYCVEDVEDAIQDAYRTYRIDRQEGQEHYIEVWVEKDALSDILYRITSKYGIRLMVNRGFSSTTAMHDAFKRLRDAQDNDKSTTLIYVGDHDPSGLFMLQDIQQRLEEFGVYGVNVEPTLLTMSQIEKYELPPNPAKTTDPRAKWYFETYGDESWEVDAVDPQELTKIVTASIEEKIDMNKYNIVMERERIEAAVIKGLPEEREKRQTTIDKLNQEIEELELRIGDDVEADAFINARIAALEDVLKLLS